MTKTDKTGYFGGVINPQYFPDEYQEIIDLQNGYSLSIIKGRISHGWWEAAVFYTTSGQLCYNTDLTYDVERFNSDDEVREFIALARTMDSNGKLPK